MKLGPQVRYPTRGCPQDRGQDPLHQGSSHPAPRYPPASPAQAPPCRSQAPPGREGQGRGRKLFTNRLLLQVTSNKIFSRTSTPRSLPSVLPRPRPTRPMPASDEQALCASKFLAFNEKKGNHTLVLWFACNRSEDSL